MPSEYFGIFARRAASREGRGEQQLGKGLVRRRQLGRTARSIQATSYRDHAIRPRISLSLALAVMVVTRSTPELAGRCGALLVAAPARTAKNLYRAHRSPAEPSSRGKRKEELGETRRETRQVAWPRLAARVPDSVIARVWQLGRSAKETQEREERRGRGERRQQQLWHVLSPP